MKTLKSIEEFKKEGNYLNSDELKQIDGGARRTWTSPTCKYGCDDRVTMTQDWLLGGDGCWYPDGPAWQIDFCYVDAACLAR